MRLRDIVELLIRETPGFSNKGFAVGIYESSRRDRGRRRGRVAGDGDDGGGWWWNEGKEGSG